MGGKEFGTRDWGLGVSKGRGAWRRLLGALCGTVIVTLSPVCARANVADETFLTIRVFDYSDVPEPTLRQAKGEATRIFAEVAVAIEWIDCPMKPEDAEANPVCRGGLEPNVVVVRIQPRFSPALSPSFRNLTLGFAPLVEGERGAYANIFQDRVQALARGGEFSEALILGHAVAHEIGHLMLRTMTHSATGLMRARLGRDELKLAQMGRLLFTREQGKLILGEVLARNATPLTAESR